ncbi:hypothetical protein JKF63_07352 [Porcisia hertigi]|uniref:Iron hydrogenase large subunit C-terminal domain-containing protein n=1 Tax=Porcisia hertigi TaxID=2761500 RepID=A0A836LKR4_9TRYP|nr:hypothetical protein JKF63_07352 [Porcisia hertigi]
MTSHHDAFSPSLTLAGMDYIAPSAACIKPSLISGGGSGTADLSDSTTSTRGAVGMRRGGNVAPSSLSPGGAATAQYADVVKISLQDCLACSGCVTTAETVLVNAQSRHEIVSALLKSLSSSSRTATGCTSRPRLVSISSQSCASLAAYLHMSTASVYELIAGFVRATLSTAALQDAARNAEGAAAGSPRDAGGYEEEAKGAPLAATMDAAPLAFPLSEPQIYVIDLEWAEQLSAELTAQEYNRRCRNSGSAEVGPLPLIVSACPGWVCYCEKQGSALLPHLCPVMSAQGIAGSYAKRTVAPDMYHISIQPCFDRKLEAARDFMASPTMDRTTNATDPPIFYTDCVLSTAELLEWMREMDSSLPWRGRLDTDLLAPVDLAGDYQKSHTDQRPRESNEEEVSTSSPPAATSSASVPAREAARLAGSGGYHQVAIAHRLRVEGSGTVLPSSSPSSSTQSASTNMVYEVKRNHNHQIITCGALPNEAFCIGYGFQQVQNVVRGLKKRTPAMRSYTFIELMACPDGCLNGGGQVRPAQQPHSRVLDAVIDAYARCMEWRRAAGDPAAATAGAISSSLPVCVVAGANHDASDEEKDGKDDTIKTERHGDASPSPPLHNSAEAVWRPFAYATIAAAAPSLGDVMWRCAFRDREKEFAEMLNEGNVHSLKW